MGYTETVYGVMFVFKLVLFRGIKLVASPNTTRYMRCAIRQLPEANGKKQCRVSLFGGGGKLV